MPCLRLIAAGFPLRQRPAPRRLGSGGLGQLARCPRPPRALAGAYEDIDPPRCPAGTDQIILQRLSALGLQPDAPPVWQSQRQTGYETHWHNSNAMGWTVPLQLHAQRARTGVAGPRAGTHRHQERPYPGLCRTGLHQKLERSTRFHLEKFIENYKKKPFKSSATSSFLHRFNQWRALAGSPPRPAKPASGPGLR